MSHLDLWSLLPKYNRRSDATGDLQKFIACLQVPTDELCAEIDRFPDIFDIERAPEPWVDLILQDLGCPFQFDLDLQAKRRLAAVLAQMYRGKGTAAGIQAAIEFLLGVEVEAVSGGAESAATLGLSELGEDWELGPSDRFSKYAFDIATRRALTPVEAEQVRAVATYMKPAHTHLANILWPTAPAALTDWVLGDSPLAEATVL